MAKPKKRKDERYRVQIYLGRDENGKSRYKQVYGKSPKEANKKADKVRLELGKGLDILSQRDTFAQWADDWLRGKKAAKITAGQKANYDHAVSVWKEELSGLEIGQIRADDIERKLISMQEENYADRTIAFYKSTIKQILRRAVGRVLANNPVDQVQLTTSMHKAEKRRALTNEEQQWIWDTPHRCQPVAIIMMLSGLRRGELAALTWQDVDFNNNTITVNKVIEYPPNDVPTLRHMTKSDCSMRVIDVPQKLIDYMQSLPRDNVLIVHTVTGRVMTVSAWTALWSSYMKVLNRKYGTRTPADLERMKKPGQHLFDMTIPPFTMHWMRHTFCTIMYLAGVDVVQARAQMGHADVTTTLKIYTHLDAAHKRKAADKLNAYFSDNTVQTRFKKA